MKFSQFIITVIIAMLTTYGISTYITPKPENRAPITQSAYDRVSTSKEIRCSYTMLYPYVVVDPNTKQLSGIFYETMNEVGKRIGLKVSWVEEVGFGNINQGFETRRYDAFCSGLWPSGVRSSNTIFSNPIGYDVVAAWVRADDNRFDSDISKLNSESYTVSAFDGDTTMSIAQNIFPKAKILALSQNQTTNDGYMDVMTGKADAVFTTYTDSQNFAKTNPNSIKDLIPPVRVIPLTIGFNDKELLMKKLVDPVINEMHDDGTIQRITTKYLGEKQNYFLMPTVPYGR